ncbi:MAG: hypothetical protein EOO20_28070 [Chryseobacterium sp.]|nr:MAG: hypothetical protein EOO20_28070 [Chryseobacterium sp.]
MSIIKKIKGLLFSKSKEGYIPELIALIKLVKSKVTEGSDIIWTKYESDAELRKELDIAINQLQSGNISSLEELNIHFAPTSTFQEHSMSNGWVEEYIIISTKFDRLYKKIKK